MLSALDTAGHAVTLAAGTSFRRSRSRCAAVPVQGPGRLRAGGRRLLLRPRGPRRPAGAPAAAATRRSSSAGRPAAGSRRSCAPVSSPRSPTGALPGSEGWRVALFTPGPRPARRAALPAHRDGTPTAAPTLDELRANPALGPPRLARRATAAPLVHRPVRGAVHALRRPGRSRRPSSTSLAAHLDPADSRSRAVLVDPGRLLRRVRRLPVARPPDHRQPGAGRADGPVRAPARHRAAGARVPGSRSTTALTEAVLDEAGGESGSLPLVAHALMETWTRRTAQHPHPRRLPRRGRRRRRHRQERGHHLRRPSSTTSSAGPRAGCSSGWSPPATDNPDTRRRMSQAELDATSSRPPAHGHRRASTAARLLTVDDTSVAIAHEALIRTWPRFRGWIEEDRENLLIRQRISRAAGEWDDQDRDPDLLLPGHAARGRDRVGGRQPARAQSARAGVPRRRQSSRARRSPSRGRAAGGPAPAGAAGRGGRARRRSPSRRSCRPRSPSPRRAARTRASEQRPTIASAPSLAASGERFVDADPYLAMILAVESGAGPRPRRSTPAGCWPPVASRWPARRSCPWAVPSTSATPRRSPSIRPAGWPRPGAGRTHRALGPGLPPVRRPSSPATPRASSAQVQPRRLPPRLGRGRRPRCASGRCADTTGSRAAGPRLTGSTSSGTSAFSPDGTRLAAATEKGIIRLYDVGTRAPLAPAAGHPLGGLPERGLQPRWRDARRR